MQHGAIKKIVVLTGAGISAESGISTFRDSNGLWENHRIEDVATPEAYKRDPLLVWKFYSMRRIQAARAVPNRAHEVLARFAELNREKNQLQLITQNVDVLHQWATSSHALEILCMHGSLHESSCTNCGTIYFDDFSYFDLSGNYAPHREKLCHDYERASSSYLHGFKLEYRDFLPISPCCKTPIRPNIVWFGEIPYFMDKIIPLLNSTDLFLTIGTSGVVYPAAGFIQIAKMAGARTVCINKEMIPQRMYIDEFLQGNVTEILPDYLDSLL